MPITKQDVMSFGATLKDTLTTWGEQIQYGRDIAKLEKVQNQLSNVKNFTTDEKGNPLNYEDVTKKIMGVTNQLTDIRTPEVMKLAQTNVGEFIKTNFKGLIQDTQNRFDQGVDAIQNPMDAPAMESLTKTLPKGMYQYKAGVPSKHYASKVIHEAITDADGNVDKQFVNQYALITNTRGGVEKVFLGKIDRTKANVMEQEQMAREEMENRIKVKSTPSRSFSSIFTNRPNEYKQARIKDNTYNFDERSGKVLVDGKWVDPSTLGGIESFVGTSSPKEDKVITDFEIAKRFTESKKVLENLISSKWGEYSDKAINQIIEAAKVGQLWQNKYWYELDQQTRDMIQNILFPDYMQEDPNK